MLVITGWWPHDIPFDSKDLSTVLEVINERNKNGSKQLPSRR